VSLKPHIPSTHDGNVHKCLSTQNFSRWPCFMVGGDEVSGAQRTEDLAWDRILPPLYVECLWPIFVQDTRGHMIYNNFMISFAFKRSTWSRVKISSPNLSGSGPTGWIETPGSNRESHFCLCLPARARSPDSPRQSQYTPVDGKTLASWPEKALKGS